MKRNLAVLVVCFSSLFLTAPAWALDCDSAVVDQAGKLGAAGVNRVVAAATPLVNQGAEVRVHVLTSSVGQGFNNLDEYKKAMQKACPSWRSADGSGMMNTLIVMVIAMDKQTGIYFGDAYKRTLENEWSKVVTGSMNPRFRDGKFADGIIAGLQKIGQLIQVIKEEPAPVAQVPVPAPAPYRAPTPVVIHQAPSQPPDLSGLWMVMGGVVGLIGTGGLLWAIMFFLQARARRKAAQQRALAKRSACNTDILGMDEQLTLAEARIKATAAKVSVEDLIAAQQAFNNAKAASKKATSLHTELNNSNVNDPTVHDRSEEEYAGIATAYEEILTQIRTFKEELSAVDAAVVAAQKRIEQARPQVAALSKAISEAISAVNALAVKGFMTSEAEAQLQQASGFVDEAIQAMEQKRYAAVSDICRNGRAAANRAAVAAASVVKNKEVVDINVLGIKNRLATVTAKIVQGRKMFAEISSQYAEGCWASIRGNGTEAEKRLEAAIQAVDDAETAASMEKQEFAKAEQAMAQANAWLDEAESFMRSIATLQISLESAKNDAQPEIDAAQADIVKANAYIKEFDDDIRDSLWADLKAAGTQLQSARDELTKAKPDYFKVVKAAKAANASADKILEQAQDEHEAAERQRRRAVSSLRDAEAAIMRAKEYIEDHQRDVHKIAKNKLVEAGTALQQALSTRDLASRIIHADNSHALADAAYKKAKSDVTSVEEAREAVRQQQAAAARALAEQQAAADRRREERSYTSTNDAFAGGLVGGIIGSQLGHSSPTPAPVSNNDFGGWGQSSNGGGGAVGWGTSNDGGGGQVSSPDPTPSSDGGGGSSDW